MVSRHKRPLAVLLPLIVILGNVLFGGRLWRSVATAGGLGPGWPELLQGLSSMLMLVLLLCWVLMLKRRAKDA